MARFDVYPNPGAHADTTPYLLDVQADLLADLDTRVVVPLRSLKKFPDVALSDRLTPLLTVNEEEFLLETPKMAAVPKRILRSPATTLSQSQKDKITVALDFLFHGY
jgi:toxin CcdB